MARINPDDDDRDIQERYDEEPYESEIERAIHEEELFTNFDLDHDEEDLSRFRDTEDDVPEWGGE